MYYPNSYQIGMNPMQPQINRLQQMEQQYGQMQQPNMPIQQPQAPPQQEGVIPVGGLEEVRAYNNYWDGMPKYFIDNNTDKIYIKQLGLNGAPIIKTYKLSLESEKQENSIEYATKEELENIKSVVDDLLQKLGGVE